MDMRSRRPSFRPADLDAVPDRGDDADWAHVSGWALLSGRRRTLSCIVTCGAEARAIAHGLPSLSDILTECGYPFEVLLVDAGLSLDTAQVVRRWAELPGFRRLAAPSSGLDGRDVEAGLIAARGEGVLFVHPSALPAVALVPRLVERWDAGDTMLQVRFPAAAGASALVESVPAGGVLTPELLAFGLLDRSVVDALIGTAR